MEGSAAASADIARRIQEGDAQAESELYRRFGAGVRQILLKATRNPALADELSQDTLIIVLKRLRSTALSEPERLPAFIAQTARNLAVAERRKARRRRTDTASDELDEMIDPEGQRRAEAETDLAAQAVRGVLESLKSARDRTVLVRYYLQDEDKEAICRDLGISAHGFSVVLFRARNKLLGLLQELGIRRADL